MFNIFNFAINKTINVITPIIKTLITSSTQKIYDAESSQPQEEKMEPFPRVRRAKSIPNHSTRRRSDDNMRYQKSEGPKIKFFANKTKN
jgi:hypothetical protein